MRACANLHVHFYLAILVLFVYYTKDHTVGLYDRSSESGLGFRCAILK